MQKTVVTTWNETAVLYVTGDYSKAIPMSRDRVNPPESADFEINKIEYKGVDVSELFDDETYYKLQDKCLTLLDN